MHQANSRDLARCMATLGYHPDIPAVQVPDVQTLHDVEETRIRTPIRRQLRARRVAGMHDPNIPIRTGQIRPSSR